jgi:hypothetical protein
MSDPAFLPLVVLFYVMLPIVVLRIIWRKISSGAAARPAGTIAASGANLADQAKDDYRSAR